MRIINTLTTFKAYKMPEAQARYLSNSLLQNNTIDIVCHNKSDADTANAALAMWKYLSQMGVQTKIILDQEPSQLNIDFKDSNILQADSFELEDENPDAVLLVDFNSNAKTSANVSPLIKNTKNLYCIDHHKNPDLFNKNDAMIIEDNNYPNKKSKVKKCYVDVTATSATSVIYRFFESLNEDISFDVAYNLMHGFVSDARKKGLVIVDGENGVIYPQQKLINDKNSYEVYLKLKEILDEDKSAMEQIAKSVDVMSALTLDEVKFYQRLQDETKLSKNGKVAYTVIPLNDSTWDKKDLPRPSAIMNNYRVRFLNKYPEVDYVVNFYQSNDNYQYSIHSRKDITGFYEFMITNASKSGIPFVSTGGHETRGGGRIKLLGNLKDERNCAKLVELVVNFLSQADEQENPAC